MSPCLLVLTTKVWFLLLIDCHDDLGLTFTDCAEDIIQDPGDAAGPTASEAALPHGQYLVEDIFSVRRGRQGDITAFEVKWRGYSTQENTMVKWHDIEANARRYHEIYSYHLQL